MFLMFCRLFCLHFHVSFLFSNSRKVGISTRGAGSIWSLKNIQLCKSAVKNLRYQTQRHVFIPFEHYNTSYTNHKYKRSYSLFILLSCRLQLNSLQFNRSEPSEKRIRRFCLHRYWQHPGTQWAAGRERREGKQVHSPHLCSLPSCTWTPLYPRQGSKVMHIVIWVNEQQF